MALLAKILTAAMLMRKYNVKSVTLATLIESLFFLSLSKPFMSDIDALSDMLRARTLEKSSEKQCASITIDMS